MSSWLDQQEQANQTKAFDKQSASEKLRRSVSHRADQTLVQRRWRIKEFLEFGQIPTVFFAPLVILIALLWRGIARRVSIFCLVILLVVGLPSFAARQLAILLVPGTHAYLDDYVYWENIDLLRPTGKVAAYDVQSFQYGPWRVIAFDDGHVEDIPDDRARQLFEQQGLAYPETRERDPEND